MNTKTVTLESWIRETTGNKLSEKKLGKLLASLAQYRETIEYHANYEFKPGKMDWKEYSKSLWYYIPTSDRELVTKYL